MGKFGLMDERAGLQYLLLLKGMCLGVSNPSNCMCAPQRCYLSACTSSRHVPMHVRVWGGRGGGGGGETALLTHQTNGDHEGTASILVETHTKGYRSIYLNLYPLPTQSYIWGVDGG